MTFLSTEWFWLVPFVVFAAYQWPKYGLTKLRRVVLASLFILALAEPIIENESGGMDLWVLVDRSDSASEFIEKRLSEWEIILKRSKPSGDNVKYLDFAGVASLRARSDGGTYEGGTDASRIGLALHTMLARKDDSKTNRVLALTDGYATDRIDNVLEKLNEEQVVLDYRLLVDPGARDFQVEQIETPGRVEQGEAFLAEVHVSGNRDQSVPISVYRGRTQIFSGQVSIKNGRGVLRFTDRMNESGALKYTAKLGGGIDVLEGNNISSQWVEIVGSGKVLLLTSYQDDPIVSLLKKNGYEMIIRRPGDPIDIGILSGARTVIINNVGAFELSQEFVNSLDFFVRGQGGGLMMIGGEKAYGSGGYFGSSVEPLLPVSMELKQEHRRMSVALAIVLDRSGSMGATVQGGKLTKMELANEGSAQAIELLGGMDLATAFAVDSKAHEVTPLMEIGSNREAITDAVRRIRSGGGGIYVYTGLQAAWDELQKAPSGFQRHIVLFTDAADSEEPGNYKQLLAEMELGKGTVSVIGLGTEGDSDADFIKDVAKRGRGRIFFSNDPKSLPTLFVQEVSSVARSTFLKEITPTVSTGRWKEVSAGGITWPGSVDGYNLCYLREEASTALLSKDEYEAPLIAYWQRGSGRVAAVTFPTGGEYSASVRGWKDYGDFMQSITRWITPQETPPGLFVRTDQRSGEVVMDVIYSDSWEGEFAKTPPSALALNSQQEAAAEVQWSRIEPGRYRARIPLDGDGYVRGAVTLGNVVLPFGPISAGRSPEWSFDRRQLEDFRELAAKSGGKERLDFAEIWDAPRTLVQYSLRPWLLTAFILFFLIDALFSRLGWDALIILRGERFKPVYEAVGSIQFTTKVQRKPKQTRVQESGPAHDEPAQSVSPKELDEKEQVEERSSRFKKAKRRGL